jgi:hypothetical protein
MKIRIAVIAACAGTFAASQIGPAQAAFGNTAASVIQERTADLGALPEFISVPETLKLPPASTEARKDIGCIGWHGRASGESKKGKCIAKKHA